MGKFNFRFILKTLGFLLIMESLFMMLTAIVSFYYKELIGDVFLTSGAITIIAGIILRLVGSENSDKPIGKRESFLVVTLTWVILSLFGMLPYYLSGAAPSISHAYFETMSGFTTTGATIFEQIEVIPKGLLFWRSITQWIGGIGIVVFALALLPILGGNASFLYDAESSSITRERFQPRITQVAKRLWLMYVLITFTLIALLAVGPMDMFDATCHALTSISTGGFSTKQNGLDYWDSAYIDYTVSLFMFIGGVNFSLLYFLFKGKPQKLIHNEEFIWYACIVIIFTVIITFGLFTSGERATFDKSLRTSLVQVVSLLTSTGLTTQNYVNWGPVYSIMFYILMFSCASAGSTSGGLKVGRLIVLAKNTLNEFKRQVHPNAILPVRVSGQVIPADIVTKVLAFTFLYLSIIMVTCLILTLNDFSIEEAMGASISCMSNVGPGFGEIGEIGHFAQTTEITKWTLCFVMLTGRLELFTVLSLFIPSFWKK